MSASDPHVLNIVYGVWHRNGYGGIATACGIDTSRYPSHWFDGVMPSHATADAKCGRCFREA